MNANSPIRSSICLRSRGATKKGLITSTGECCTDSSAAACKRSVGGNVGLAHVSNRSLARIASDLLLGPGWRHWSPVQKIKHLVGMSLVNEFIVNSLKYAFDHGDGTIGIRLDDRPPGTACLTLWDDGKGLPQGLRAGNYETQLPFPHRSSTPPWLRPCRPTIPLWSMPNVLITPHVAIYGTPYREKWEAMLIENCRRFAAGQPLFNLVDKAKWF